MKLLRGVRIALRTLFGHRLRTALATLGIVVGVCAVIVMVAIGEGAQREVLGRIQAMGTDLVVVTSGQVKVIAGRRRQTGNVTTLTLRDLAAVRERARGVLAAAPSQSRKVAVRYETLTTTTTVDGTTPEILEIRALALGRGRFFTDEENRSRQRVAVLGRTVANNLFGGRDPLGEQIRVGRVAFEVVGVLAAKGTDLVGGDQDDVIFVPVETALRRLFNLSYVNSIFVRARGSAEIDLAAGEVAALLRERHRLGSKPDDFTIQTQTEVLRVEQQTAQTFTNLLSAVAGVSLVVGGVGILAVMLIAVKERTREIGVRRAVGALRRDLLLQFVVESVVLGVSGGAVGVLLGVALAFGTAWLARWPVSLPASSIALAFCSSAAIGLVFGVYPAAKAARLDPIEALRAE